MLSNKDKETYSWQLDLPGFSINEQAILRKSTAWHVSRPMMKDVKITVALNTFQIHEAQKASPCQIVLPGPWSS